jgi:hypothetical protein
MGVDLKAYQYQQLCAPFLKLLRVQKSHMFVNWGNVSSPQTKLKSRCHMKGQSYLQTIQHDMLQNDCQWRLKIPTVINWTTSTLWAGQRSRYSDWNLLPLHHSSPNVQTVYNSHLCITVPSLKPLAQNTKFTRCAQIKVTAFKGLHLQLSLKNQCPAAPIKHLM